MAHGEERGPQKQSGYKMSGNLNWLQRRQEMSGFAVKGELAQVGTADFRDMLTGPNLCWARNKSLKVGRVWFTSHLFLMGVALPPHQRSCLQQTETISEKL